MRAIRRILVAVKDPAVRSVPAIHKAVQIAQGSGAHIELFHALSETIYVDAVGLGTNGEAMRERALHDTRLRQLESIAAPLRKRGVEITVTAEWDYPPHEAIVRRALRTNADLIIAGTHPTAHKAPWLLRFTDWELLRLSPVPVLLVRNPKPYRRPKLLAAVDPSHAFSKPSKLDERILSSGETLAAALNGTLHAVHAYMPLPVGLGPATLTTADITEQVVKDAAEKAAKDFERTLRSTDIPKARRHLEAGHPVTTIPKVAREIGSAIVVMGAISRSGIKRVFIGNTAERLLDRLTCDVLVVKPARFVSAVKRASRGPHIVMVTTLMPPAL